MLSIKSTLKALINTNSLKSFRWGTDYLLKVYPNDELVTYVGDYTTENTYWGRPEDESYTRTTTKRSLKDQTRDATVGYIMCLSIIIWYFTSNFIIIATTTTTTTTICLINNSYY